jgi:hypothetical protein
MDDQRFDALVRALGDGASRRTVLTGLRVAMLGGALTLLGQQAGAAARGRKHHARQQTKRRGKDRAKAVHAQQADLECAAKVGICHRTGSEKNPLRYLNVCVDAVPAHAAHGDLVACPGAGVIDPETCTCFCPLTEEVDCLGNFEVDEDLCACVCPLTQADCPGGVDAATCECILPLLTCDRNAPVCGPYVPCDGGPCHCWYSFENGNPQGPQYCAEPIAFCADVPQQRCTDTSECPDEYFCSSTCCNNALGGLCFPACGSGVSLGARSAGDTEGLPSPGLP